MSFSNDKSKRIKEILESITITKYDNNHDRVELTTSLDQDVKSIDNLKFAFKSELGSDINELIKLVIDKSSKDTEKEIKNKKKLAQSQVINEVFDEISSNLPIKVKFENETTIACIVKDKENKIITPYIINDNGFKKLIKTNSDVAGFFEEFHYALKEKGINIDDIDELWNEFESRSLNSITRLKHYKLEKFKTFSFDKDEWKVSYINPVDIENADNNTSAWDSFGDKLGNEELKAESYELFKAWCWTLFDEQAINHNRQALWMYGDGFDGKSVVTKVLASIIAGEYEGTTGTGSIGIGQLNKEFWATSFYGKNLVTINEVGDSDLFSRKANDGPGGKLHQITGHDIVAVEGKGKQPFEARIKSRIILFANCAPTFNSMQNNEVTRMIPIHVSKSHYKGLNHFNPDFEYTDWGKDLYDQRFAFLKKCREAYLRRMDKEQMLLRVSNAYQEEYFQKSEYVETVEDIAQYIDRGTKIYSASSIKLYMQYVCENKFKQKCGTQTFSNILRTKGITKKKVSLHDGSRINAYYCELNNDVIADFNAVCDTEKKLFNKIYEILQSKAPIVQVVEKTKKLNNADWT